MQSIRSLEALAADPASDPAAADAACRQLATSHYENFDVVSFLVPRSKRAHMARLYAFCRHTDDLGDEAGASPEDRLFLLDRWAADLARCWDGQPSHPYLVALAHTIRELGLNRQPFERLIEANRMDQRVSRYSTFADLRSYCRHSAEPVGEMVLQVFGCANPQTLDLSNKICTGLQLANFCQDVSVDRAKGRIYLPLEDLERFGVSEAALDAPRATEDFVRLVAFEVERARALLIEGTPLVSRVPQTLRPALGGFVRGGLAILDRIAAKGYDVLKARPTLSKARKAAIAILALFSQALGRW